MKQLLLILFLASPALAISGPKYSFDDPKMNDELNNVYRGMTYPKFVNATGSTMTVTQLNVSTASVKQIQFKDGTTQITAATSKWVQIALGSATATTSTTSTSYVDTNLSVAITPTSASNCILVIATSDGGISANAVAFNVFFTLANGTTNLNAANGGATATAIAAASGIRFPVALVAPQCPATTTPQTYKVRIKVEDTSVTGLFIAGSGTGRIWAIEYVP